MREHVFADRSALDEAVGRWLDGAVAGRQGFVALAVGASTLPAYGRLGPLPDGLTVLTLDELVPAPADLTRTFANRLQNSLPGSWAVAVRPFEPGPWDAGDVDALGPTVDRSLDGRLVAAVCGLGPDGHVAFNQPPDDGHSPSRLVTLTGPNLARLGPVAPATAAFTLGLGPIRAAARLAVVVAGPGKEEAAERLRGGPAGPDCPASHLAGHPEVDVFSLRLTGRGPAPPN